jgi:uncharacterized protein (DUF2147 family)
MRSLWLSGLLALALASPAAAADPVEGQWLIQTKRVIVTMTPCASADKLCGKITWLKQPLDDAGKPRRDDNNPDSARRNDPLMGMMLVRDFKRVEPGRWAGGKIYDPNSGKTYDSKMRLMTDGTLKLDGCVLIICISQTWTRPPG